MSRRGLTVVGLAAAGGVGYYLYNAGGDPKVAEKNFKADASKAERKIKDEAPGREKEAERKGEEYAQRAASQFDKTVSDGKTKLREAESAAEDYRQKAGKEANKAIDKFDKTVEDKAAQAKSGISGWFGGK